MCSYRTKMLEQRPVNYPGIGETSIDEKGSHSACPPATWVGSLLRAARANSPEGFVFARQRERESQAIWKPRVAEANFESLEMRHNFSKVRLKPKLRWNRTHASEPAQISRPQNFSTTPGRPASQVYASCKPLVTAFRCSICPHDSPTGTGRCRANNQLRQAGLRPCNCAAFDHAVPYKLAGCAGPNSHPPAL